MNARRLTVAMLVSLCALAGTVAFSASASAFNVHVFTGTFGVEGSGPGQLKEPRGIAVNDTTHNVYVADSKNRRVEEFTSTGVYIGEFAPPGGFSNVGFEPGPSGIAVDNSGSPLDPSAGDVYVVDRFGGVIDKFSETGTYQDQLTKGEGGTPFGEPRAVAVDSAGLLWVAQETLQESKHVGFVESFSDAQVNVFQSQLRGFGGGPSLAADSEGRLYADGGAGFLRRTAAGELHETFTENREDVTGLAVDTSNNEVYADSGGEVEAYDSRLLLQQQIGAGHLSSGKGIAVDSSTHAVYVADSAADQVAIFDQKVLPDVSTGEEPTNLQHEGTVTLDGTVNPEGIPVTSCEFEYGTEEAYGNTAPCEPAPGSGSGAVSVHAVITGLSPLTRYHYRLVAGNENGSHPGIDRTFIAPTHPAVGGESVVNVSADGATLSGRVNPGGAPTTYRFEYGPSASYGQSISGDAGSGISEVEVGVHPQGLTPGTTYHYRLVAENQVEAVAGLDHTFITQRAGGSVELPDGRAWEMVSPPNKQGGLLLSVGIEQGALIQSAADGGAITFVASAPTEVEPPGSRAPENIQVLSGRGSSGWASRVIATPHDATHQSLVLGSSSEYQLFSSDLSLGLVRPRGAMPLSEETTERTPYLRHDTECEANPTVCYQPLVTAGNVAPGTKFGGELHEADAFTEIEIAGASSDLSHVVLQSKVALTAGGAPGLYEWTGGKLVFVGAMELGYREDVVRNAVSEDGSRVIGSGKSEGLEGLLLRDVATGKTTKLDAPEPEAAGGEGAAVFQTASSDGSRVFFTDDAQLTTDSTATNVVGDEKPDLYEFNLRSGKLSDLSVDPDPGQHADVQAVLGASEDGSYVYFAASGALTEHAVPANCDSAEPGASCNVYVRHEGTTKLIATLSDEDAEWSGLHTGGDLRKVGMRVSPNGLWFAFTSNRSLTGYDNRDAVSGKPDEEVFLYDASSESVVCASCDPTGARPVGEVLTVSIINNKPQLKVNASELWNHVSVSATVPGWEGPSESKAVYQPRYLSNSGRLFFNSDDALVPQDTDGTWDVYEYEPAGIGGCTQTDVTFGVASNGCVGLISSGGSQTESIFMDASENGDDVFFLTSAGLVPQDYDGEFDLYDAHACRADAPCFPVAPVAPPPCSTGDSCKAAPTPQPGIFGAPSSETFSGAGNVSSPAAVPGKRAKSLTRAQKLERALKACRKQKARSRRLSCERQAKKQYGGKTTKSAAHKSVSSRTGR